MMCACCSGGVECFGVSMAGECHDNVIAVLHDAATAKRFMMIASHEDHLKIAPVNGAGVCSAF